MDVSRLNATAARARAFSATLARIDGALMGSLAAMRRSLANERHVSTRAKDEADRYTVAVHDFGRLKIQAQELAKAIYVVTRNVRSLEASCQPPLIPPLFSEGRTPSISGEAITGPIPIPRKRPVFRVFALSLSTVPSGCLGVRPRRCQTQLMDGNLIRSPCMISPGSSFKRMSLRKQSRALPKIFGL